MKKTMAAICTVPLVLSLLAGCANSNGELNGGNAAASTEPSGSPETSETAQSLDPVQLTWYYPLTQQQADQQMVEDEVNKYIKDKINATVKLMPVSVGDYVQKMNTVLAAGEEFDILWTGYLLHTEVLASKGALQPLDELLTNDAPELKAAVPQVIWDGLKIDGQLYGIPNQQISAFRNGVLVQKRFADKYNLDVSSIKKMEDLEPFLEQIKQNEPDIIPYGNFGSQYYPHSPNWSVPVGSDYHFFVKKGDTSYQLLNYPEEDLDAYRLASKWYKAGYIYKDAGTSKMTDFEPQGLIAVLGSTTLKPGIEQDEQAKNGGNEVIAIPLEDWYTNGYSDSTNQAISRTSRNPESAMMFLNLVNTDKTLYNLLINGIEGVHYDKISDDVIKAKDGSRYAPNMDWVFGSVFNSYLKEGQSATIWEETKKINETAEVNPIGGFKFNSEPVSTELANLNAVWGEYKQGLATGTLDFDTTWPKLQERLKKAGQEKYAAEVAKQFNEYLEQRGLK
ncbi:ABC transporter substrate-binding protein [Cohnella fermenti]|uniref:Extracellular solute-binding protein n=1 Tax=Cohnella fermenti TaxID=2565925 RepID=A0A4S4BHC7_9BACL|nr:ABC transporter substrate-binding protein [Cohnella fermenti]THF73341.1 extracellular solute-binding protein [Cohnella fermenti]